MKGRRIPRRQAQRDGGPEALHSLIHRNNCSEPASMRVSGRFDYPEDTPLDVVQATINFAFGPLGWLMRRRVDETT